MDLKGSPGDAGTDGGFACSCRPTESDCISAEVSAGTEHSFYQERRKMKTGKMRVSAGMAICTHKKMA